MTRFLLILVLVLCAVAGAAAHFGYFKAPKVPAVRQAAVTSGDILQTVTATGTLQALRTVDVGSQVTGIVERLYVDYNSIVKAGQLIATLDPSTFQAQLDSAKASLDRANIALAQQQSTLDADQRDLAREEQLFAHSLASEQEREAAQLVVKEDQALVTGDKAAIAVAADAIEQAEVNLGYCTIRSPIDGVVVTRNADEGQTVTSSLTVPSLFILANDIKRLQLVALVDEADIGKLHPGQDATFGVDAYPNRQFHGTMDRVRLNASLNNNVVTYQAVAEVANPELRLLPSMTANVKVQIARATGVVRVPNAALRYTPTADIFKAIGEKPVPAATTAASSPKPAPAAGRVALDSGMIDQFFQGMPRQSSTGQVWVMDGHQSKNVPVKLGITDGTWTELVSGPLQPNDELVVGIAIH